MSRSILLVEDDVELLALLERFFGRRGWHVLRAADGATARATYERARPDLALLDLGLPDTSGMDVLEWMRAIDADATILMLTGQADVPTAVHAMRLGAENFLTKPVDFAYLEAAVERAHEKVVLRRRSRFFAECLARAAGVDLSDEMETVPGLGDELRAAAATDSAVLLRGEAGTGKGRVARLLHRESGRDGPFVEVECAGSIGRELEAEIFGSELGPDGPVLGMIEIASRGTILLDEVADVDESTQQKLLEVLEERRFRRVGGTRAIEADARWVAATHTDPERSIEAGLLRQDLYDRLAVVTIRLPPLRQRGAVAIERLAHALLADLRRGLGRGPTGIAADAMQRLEGYPWPGNIRELRNVLERAALFASAEPEIRAAHLPHEIAERLSRRESAADLSLAEIERRHIARVLDRHGGNRSRAARALGIARATLYEKLKRFAATDAAETESPGTDA